MSARADYKMGRDTVSLTLQVPIPIEERLQQVAAAKYTTRQSILLRFLIDNIDIVAPPSDAN